MSDEDGSDEENKKVVKEPMPVYKMRFSDMSEDLQEKAIRRKLSICFIFNLILIQYAQNVMPTQNMIRMLLF